MDCERESCILLSDPSLLQNKIAEAVLTRAVYKQLKVSRDMVPRSDWEVPSVSALECTPLKQSFDKKMCVSPLIILFLLALFGGEDALDRVAERNYFPAHPRRLSMGNTGDIIGLLPAQSIFFKFKQSHHNFEGFSSEIYLPKLFPSMQAKVPLSLSGFPNLTRKRKKSHIQYYHTSATGIKAKEGSSIVGVKSVTQSNVEITPEDRNNYDKAMLNGWNDQTLIILVGVAGCGKTEVKRLLLEQNVPVHSSSTLLTGRLCNNIVVKGIQWKYKDAKRMLRMVADTIKRIIEIISSKLMKLYSVIISPVTVTIQHNLDEPECNQENITFGLDCSNMFLKALKNITLESELMEAMKISSNDYSGSESLMDENFINILDCVGQSPFREMLPHFVENAAAIVVMHKLNERLDFKPTIRYREEGGKVNKGYISQLTNEQILHQCVQGIQYHKSKVFFIGTHKDREQDCKNETRDKKNKELLKAIRPVLGERVERYRVRTQEQLIFPLNFTSCKPEDKKIAKEFRERIMKNCMEERKKIPQPWFLLGRLLKSLAQQMKVSVLSIDECCVAAKEKLYNMSCEDCKAALHHLSSMNIIFYCPNLLPNVIFISTQVIIDKLSELVRCNHALRTEEAKGDVGAQEREESISDDNNVDELFDPEDDGTTEAIPPYMNSSTGEIFKERALVDSELLKIAFPSHYREGVFTSTDLLHLLEGLLIAGRLNSGKYFIPSVLPDLPVEKIAEYRSTADHPPPLVIYYPKMWLPVGVISSLVVYLQNECGWVPSTKDLEPTCMKHNCIEFDLPEGEPGSTVLIDSVKFLEIHVKPVLRVGNQLLHKIRENVCTGLQMAHKSLHYDPPEVKIAFLCSGEQCKVSEAHIATVIHDKLKCSIDTRCGSGLSEKQKIWMKESPCEHEEGIEVPPPRFSWLDSSNLFDVKRILVSVTHRWKDIGLALRLDLGQLKKIEKQYGDLDDCLTEILSLWLSKNYNTKRFGDPSWDILARAVRDPAGGNDSALADRIIKEHAEKEKFVDAECTEGNSDYKEEYSDSQCRSIPTSKHSKNE